MALWGLLLSCHLNHTIPLPLPLVTAHSLIQRDGLQMSLMTYKEVMTVLGKEDTWFKLGWFKAFSSGLWNWNS